MARYSLMSLAVGLGRSSSTSQRCSRFQNSRNKHSSPQNKSRGGEVFVSLFVKIFQVFDRALKGKKEDVFIIFGPTAETVHDSSYCSAMVLTLEDPPVLPEALGSSWPCTLRPAVEVLARKQAFKRSSHSRCQPTTTTPTIH